MQIPWRAAPRAALSSPLTLLVSVVTALLLGFVVAAAVLHPAASGSAAIAHQEEHLCRDALHPSLETKLPHELVAPFAEHVGTTVQGQPHLLAAYTTEQRADFGGPQTYAKFGYRPGATEHLAVLEGGAKDGLWVPRSVADTIGVRVGGRGMGGRLPPVTAIYEDLRDPLPDWWCSERHHVVPNALDRDELASAVVWMPTFESFTALPRELTTATDVTVRFPADVPETVAEAEALLTTGAERLRPFADVEQVRTVSPLVLPVENARQTAVNVRSAILPLTLISLLIGLAGVATVTAQWAQRRHGELRLLWVRGAGPFALGGRAALELGLPLVVGGAAGLGVAHLLLPLYSPSDALPPGTGTTAALAVLVAVALSLVVAFGTAALRAHRAFQVSLRGNRLRRVLTALPWEPATAGLAVFAWTRVSDSGLATTEKIGGLPRIDATALAFPLLVVLTAALLAARVARWGLAASHRARFWSRPAAQLAVRRLAAAAGPVTGVLLVGVLAIGTIAVGTAISGSQRTALDTKSGMYAGANSTAQVKSDLTELPAALRGNSTIVGFVKLNDRSALVVDPATFRDGAHPVDVDPELLSAPLRVGDAPRREVALPGLPPLDPSAWVPSFPKLGTSGWVVPVDAVADRGDIGSWHVWSSKPLGELTAALAEAGVKPRNLGEKAKAVQGLPFLTIQWTFGFVTALGAVLAVVAAIALLLAVEVRRRQNALSGAFSTRMGLRPAELLGSHLLELGAVAAVALAAGLTASAVSSGFTVPRLDPAPRLTPVPEVPDVLPVLVTTVAGSVLVVAVAAWVAVRSVRSAKVGELIRG
ncbi:ABC transporter permease [Saccharothrix longispora]|uniref:ABC transport system permease protein n=1 Tax=Saccharothrix longispora TaxID=33920 RepID=A0ABU1PX00_9PSEU|nr:ABC transporter permease [Saccharothrix longispora]MDR6595180.1 putative ABC transport system permease protein [Saccharothrix longispora]